MGQGHREGFPEPEGLLGGYQGGELQGTGVGRFCESRVRRLERTQSEREAERDKEGEREREIVCKHVWVNEQSACVCVTWIYVHLYIYYICESTHLYNSIHSHLYVPSYVYTKNRSFRSTLGGAPIIPGPGLGTTTTKRDQHWNLEAILHPFDPVSGISGGMIDLKLMHSNV